jgi:hypothetical protein
MLFFSCKNDNGVMCTQEYRMLTISVKDSSSNPVLLTSSYIKKTSTGEILEFPDSTLRSQGMYVVCSDGNMQMTSGTGTEFEFYGILNKAIIVDEKYIIGNDQCHVHMISGKTNIILPVQK